MLEEQCRDIFKQACQEVIEKNTSMAWLKGRSKPPNPFQDYFRWDDKFYVWDGWLIKKVTNARKENIIRDAFLYFVHGEKLRDAYIRKKYGTLESAMQETGSFSVLFETFKQDFAKERERFMSNTAELIAERTMELKKQGKLPQSHGGVANLLKVLTQTMKQQGSSIKTIAKVQYAICLQAGIMIPEEFVTDVLVSANIENER